MNVKLLLIILTSLLTSALISVNAQSRYITEKGEVSFFSDAPLEDIKATSKELRTILDVNSGKTIAKLRIRSFDFRIGLMEEHFNENFMESEKYPEAIFRGTLRNISNFDPDDGSSVRLPLEGEITIHGVTRSIKDTVELTPSSSSVSGQVNFYLRPEDFDIEIPKILTKKIAEVVEVNVILTMKPINK
jgi:hypothetical protein